MEAHKLRFVRCPRCHQLLVEYPSIPVYKCGGCSTVLRAKNRAVPVAQAGSESEERNSESPQNNKSICSDEQKIACSNKASEAVVDGNISSTINNTNSGKTATQERALSVAESVTPAEHQNEETCSLIDGNIQSPVVLVEEIHDKDTEANSSSTWIEKVVNLDTSKDANGGKVDNFGTSEVSTVYENTVYKNTVVVQSEERLQKYESIHAESHEALIEELERSLSFSSEDEYFSDEAENSGLSDALRNQMGSHRFMLGGKMNDASRSDPHGQLIEELEMSFSDAEEPTEQHAVVTDRVYGNEHDKNSQTLGAESSRPCEESVSLSDQGNLKSGQSFHQENRRIDHVNKVKEECHTEDDSTANCVNGNEHIMVADEDIAERSYDNGKDWQSVDVEIAHPCEGSVSSLDDGNIKYTSSNAKEECHTEDDSTANCVNGNVHIVVADEDIAEVPHENGKDRQSAEVESAHPFEGSFSLVNDGNNKFKQSFEPNDVIADGTQEKEEGCMEDDSMTNYVHGNENLVFSDEDIAKRVHGNKELKADRPGEHEENHLEDDNMANCVHGNENVADADEHTAERVDKTEHGKDQQSLEAESAHLCERVISSFNAKTIKSEQSVQQNEPIANGTKEKEEDGMEDGNTTNCVQHDSAAVTSFSSLPNKRTQCKLPSFNKNKEEMPYRYRGSQLRQGLSLDSEDFRSIQNFTELQMDGTSSSLSSGSPSQGDLVHRRSNKFNNIDRHERLKKMDELRDQLSRLSSQKGLEKRYQKRGLEYQQQSNSYDVEQHLQSVDADSIPSSCALESYYGHGRPPRYQPPNPFSPTHSYTHCHFGPAQTRIPHNYDAWEFNSYYQSSYGESTILDHELLRSSYREQKRVVRKHILRPLSGASPFTICNSCFNLVQMPSDIYISKAKIGQMQCGKCSKVLALSFPAVYSADAKISMDVAQLSYNHDDSIVSKNEDIASYYAECLAGDPVSINEECGASVTRSFSAQAGPSLAATQSGKKVSDSALHRLMGYDSASQLLRHSRVFEDGYESFESMVPVSSRVSRRKNM